MKLIKITISHSDEIILSLSCISNSIDDGRWGGEEEKRKSEIEILLILRYATQLSYATTH